LYNGKLKVENGKFLRNFSSPRPLRERVRVRGYLNHSHELKSRVQFIAPTLKGGATC